MAATTPARRKPKVAAARAAAPAPSTFDFEEFLAGFVRPEFTAALIRRADLMPKLAEKLKVLDDLDDRIDRLEKAAGDDGGERDITAVDPLSELTARRERLTLEYNDIAQVYNDSAVEFTFRVPDKKDDHIRIQAMMDEIGAVQPDTPEIDSAEDPQVTAKNQTEFEAAFTTWWDALAIRSMSVTCISHPGTAAGAPPLTVPQWEALRDRVGQGAFTTLGTAWFGAVQAVAPSVPFLPRPLPTPAPPELSDESGPPSG